MEIKVQRAAIVLHLADGGCPDPSGIADDIPASHGWRQLKKRISLESAADLDAARVHSGTGALALRGGRRNPKQQRDIRAKRSWLGGCR